jgi:prepilin signal peptidase PulO-like enzyme (type II secretory pathway)
LFVLFFFKHQEFSLILVRDWTFLSFLTILFVYDLRHMLLLDRFTIPAMIVAIILNLWLGAPEVSSMLLGALAIGGFFYGQFALSSGKWVGGGDIRMGALMGFMLGLSQGLVALFLSYLIGAIVGIILLLMKKAQGKTPLPFGTFLSLSAAIILFFGDVPLRWYLSLFI